MNGTKRKNIEIGDYVKIVQKMISEPEDLLMGM
jgi:hypothetical protein